MNQGMKEIISDLKTFNWFTPMNLNLEEEAKYIDKILDILHISWNIIEFRDLSELTEYNYNGKNYHGIFYDIDCSDDKNYEMWMRKQCIKNNRENYSESCLRIYTQEIENAARRLWDLTEYNDCSYQYLIGLDNYAPAIEEKNKIGSSAYKVWTTTWIWSAIYIQNIALREALVASDEIFQYISKWKNPARMLLSIFKKWMLPFGSVGLWDSDYRVYVPWLWKSKSFYR